MVGTIPVGFFAGSATSPILHQYSTPGTYSETIPSGISQVVIEVWGPGGGGSAGDKAGPDNGDGASSGGYACVTAAVPPSNWGATFIVVVGVTGAGGSGTGGGGQPGTDATDSSVAKNTGLPTVLIQNTHGVKGIQFSGSTGLTPTISTSGTITTQTQGNSVSPGTKAGGAAIVGVHGTAGAGGNGGSATVSNNGPGQPGSAGLVSFYYT